MSGASQPSFRQMRTAARFDVQYTLAVESADEATQTAVLVARIRDREVARWTVTVDGETP